MKPLTNRIQTSSQYQFVVRLLKDIRSYEKPVYVLIIGQFLNKFGAFVFPFFALFLQSRNYGKAEIALVLGAMSAGGVFAPLVSGYLSDAFGRRNTLVLCLTSSAVSLVAMYFCQNLAQLVVLSAIHGFAAFLFGPPAHALMTDLIPEEKRLTAFAFFRLALNAGFAAGPTVAGFLFERSPLLIFIGDAATTLIFAALAFFWLPHGLRTITGRSSSPQIILQSWLEALKDLRNNHPIIQYMIASFLVSICFLQVFNVLSVASTDNGLSPAQFGWVMAINGVVIVIIEMPLCQWLRRFSYKSVLVAGYLLFAMGTSAFFLADTLRGYVAAMVLFTLGEIVSFPIGMTYLSYLTPEAYRGRYFGIKGMTWGLAGVIGSIGIWIYGHIGPAWWICAGVLALLGSGMMMPRYQKASAEKQVNLETA